MCKKNYKERGKIEERECMKIARRKGDVKKWLFLTSLIPVVTKPQRTAEKGVLARQFLIGRFKWRASRLITGLTEMTFAFSVDG